MCFLTRELTLFLTQGITWLLISVFITIFINLCTLVVLIGISPYERARRAFLSAFSLYAKLTNCSFIFIVQ